VSDRDALEGIRAQVDAAYASAERLVREAEAAARAAAADVPPRGWAGPEAPPRTGSTVEALQAIAALLEVVRGAVPAELAQQVAVATRDLLIALRALIDFSLAQLEAGPAATGGAVPRAVEDIPID
jgi:hypothetical protein